MNNEHPLGCRCLGCQADEAIVQLVKSGLVVTDLELEENAPNLEQEQPLHQEAKAAGHEDPKEFYGAQKVPLQLVPSSAALAIARGLHEGVIKYGMYNWRETDCEIMTYFGSMFRHAYALIEGEMDDPDSATGKTHLDGMLASAAIIADLFTTRMVDNRPTPNEKALQELKQGSRNSLPD